MSRKAFEKYVERGPDQLTLSEVTEALDWKSDNAAEAHEVRANYESKQRAEEDRAMFAEQWVKDGGERSQIEAAWRDLNSPQRRAERLEEQENAARAEDARRFARGF
jgi:hypothetical protein